MIGTQTGSGTMKQLFAIVIFFAAVAAVLPRLLQEQTTADASAVAASVEETVSKSANKSIASVSSGEVRLKPDGAGHYVAEFRMNGRPVTALVDTGASMVAINKSTARKLGINVSPNDFIHTANTANGVTKMAVATIREVEIGRVRVRDVEAAILDDKALQGTLLGMSFLKRLEGFTVSDGDLILKQ